MKIKTDIKNIVIAICMLCAILSACFAVTVYSRAEGETYYICYERDDYRVRAANKLDADGDIFETDVLLSQGDKFLISNGKGAIFGSSKGEPITVVESGRHRYTVKFDPSVALTSYAAYAPETVTLCIDSSGTVREEVMPYRRANAVFEEYVMTLALSAGDKVTAVDEAGTVYGVKTTDGSDAYVAPMTCEYRILFTKDEDNLYDGDKYLSVADVPELYALVEANGYSRDDAYKMVRDEDVITREEYYYEPLTVGKKDSDVKFGVESGDGDVYFPSESGKVEIKDKGDYRIVYSPDRAYSESGDKSYYVSCRRMEKYYGGYYVLGDFNDFEYVEDDEFEAEYKLVKDDAVTDYDEYTLTLYFTDAELSRYDGAAEFYITDGTSLYRRPTGENIRIDRAGEYTLYFSPTHNYGRGYRYRYERVADEPEKSTVYIGSEREFAEFARQCVAPEFTLGKSVLITRSLDFSGGDAPVIACFAGELDGLFNTIKFELDCGKTYAHLIREVTADGVIKRITFDQRLRGGGTVAVVGSNAGTVEQVTAVGSVENSEYSAGNGYTGGIVGYSSGKILDCASSATVNGLINVGGIVGSNSGSVETCENSGAVNNRIFSSSDARGMLNVGGIAGYSDGNIFGCKNSGAVGLDQARYFGGIVGMTRGGVYFCENFGEVGAESTAGGIIGYYGAIADNSNNNPLYDYLVGTEYEQWLDVYFGTGDGNFERDTTSTGEVYYCRNVGAVGAENNVGGIIGEGNAAELIATACVSTAVVTAKDSRAGGIIGKLGSGAVRSCVAYGEVLAQKGNYAGGIVGEASGGEVAYCQAAAYVEAAASYCGGIAGSAKRIVNCVTHSYVCIGDGEHFGAVAGACDLRQNNFYPQRDYGAVGIDGIAYGSENSYGACAVAEETLLSVGMISPELCGLDAEYWLAGELEPRYPVPRAFTDIEKAEKYTQSGKFEAAFDAATDMRAQAEDVGKTTVTVVFYEYNIDDKKYERYDLFYILKGMGVTPPDVPQKDGYFTWWDTTDFSAFDADATVRMEYDKYLTSLASESGEHPRIIVTGKFYSDSRLEVENIGEYIALKIMRGDTECDATDLTVRYYDGDGAIDVSIINGGNLSPADGVSDGGYYKFVLPGGAQFKVTRTGGEQNLVLIISLCVVGTAVITALCFVVPMIVVRAKKKKEQNR